MVKKQDDIPEDVNKELESPKFGQLELKEVKIIDENSEDA